MVVQAVRLQEIYNVEPVGTTRPRVLNSKVKPLRVTLGVNVILHQAVVFEVRYLLS